jgi:hypothetical protein
MSQPHRQASPPEPQNFCPSTNSDQVTTLPALGSLSFARANIIICFLAYPGSYAMGSQGLEAFCVDASYIAAFKILNLPSLAIPDSPQRLSSRPDWLESQISRLIQPAQHLPTRQFQIRRDHVTTSSEASRSQMSYSSLHLPNQRLFHLPTEASSDINIASLPSPFIFPCYEACPKYGSRLFGSACWRCTQPRWPQRRSP